MYFTILKSTGSYGNWVIHLSPTESKYFWKRDQANKFLMDLKNKDGLPISVDTKSPKLFGVQFAELRDENKELKIINSKLVDTLKEANDYFNIITDPYNPKQTKYTEKELFQLINNTLKNIT